MIVYIVAYDANTRPSRSAIGPDPCKVRLNHSGISFLRIVCVTVLYSNRLVDILYVAIRRIVPIVVLELAEEARSTVIINQLIRRRARGSASRKNLSTRSNLSAGLGDECE